MAINDKQMFYKYLNNAAVYFEYGSGGSTYQANIRNNILKIYSVESDKQWHNILQKQIKTSKIRYLYNEMDTQPNTWGNPGPKATYEQYVNYSDQIMRLNKNEQNEIDLILIDGRFRVACCLKCFNIINQNCLIIFDDFLDRSHYHIVLNYFDIIDKTFDNRMVVLCKKKDISTIPNELIRKYEIIPE